MRNCLFGLLILFMGHVCGVGAQAPVSLDSGWRLQDAGKVSVGGDEVSLGGFASAGWYTAVVPGTVLTSLVDDGVYPEPLYGLNSRTNIIPDSLCRTSYWYRRVFTVPGSYSSKEIWLNFDGVNYGAQIWVNGTKVGEIEGAFTRGVFNVTHAVKAGSANVVAVEILPPTQPGDPVPQTLGKGYGPNGGVLEGNTPTFIDAIGWDWMPGIADRDMGIWQGIFLSASGPVVIKDPYVTSQITFGSTNTADLSLEVTLSNVSGQSQTGALQGSVAGRSFSKQVTIGPNGEQTVALSAADMPALHLKNPELWWPNGYGGHYVYDMPLTFTLGGVQSDMRHVSFGVRSISCGIGNSTDTMKITVNGVPIMIRGGDWGMDEAMKRSPEVRLEAQIKLNALTGFTMIRNWCGQTTQKDFYRLCDKYGILVWDEYWLDDTVHYGIEKQKAVFLANARDMLLHYRNHPCIALWCEKNEFPIGPPFESGLRKVTTDLDPQRWLQACSSSGNGVADGSYGWQPVAYYFSNFKDPFHTEIGAPSIPTLESLHGMMPASDWETFNDDWTEHDMCQFDYPIQVGERYGPVADTDDFVRKAQLIDYETYRAMFEGRNSRLLDPYTGVMIWMSNPAQPSMVWQIYSYDLEPDSSYFGVKHACEMVHIQMTPDGRVQVINNTSEELDELHVSALVCNMDGTHALYQPVVVDARPLSATNACDIKWPQTLSPVHFIRLRLSSGSGKLISDNFYWHTTPADTGDCSALQTLPHVDLGAACTRSDVSGRCDLHVTLSNPGHSVALMAHLQLRRRSSGERVLPAFYSDNYVSLLPGERKTIDIDSAEVDLHGDSPELTVDGWNVTVNPWSGRGVYIAPNPEAGFAHATSVRNIKCGYGWVPGRATASKFVIFHNFP